MTLSQWLKGKRTLNPCPALYKLTGEMDWWHDVRSGELWLIEVLDDGTAITWCCEQ